MPIEPPLKSINPGESKALLRKVNQRLKDWSRHFDALQFAMAKFGPGFDAGAFERAFVSQDPADRVEVMAVERGLVLLYNYMAELADFGLQLATVKGLDEPLNARRDFLRLKEIGVLNESQEQRIQRLRERRRSIEHEYPNVAARNAHEAASLVVSELRPYLKTYLGWAGRSFPS